jgi:hypothetical protein
MLRFVPFLLLIASTIVAAGCADNTVVQTGSIDVKVDSDVDFTQFQTFSVVTKDLIDPPPDIPEIGDEQEAFNELVNQLIIDAMQAEPVCLELIPPDQTSPENQPDLWAANGLAQSTDSGYVYECCGGWWWGYWGWYWNPCAYWCPTYVEYEVGSLFVPVGEPPAEGEDPAAVFAGLARSVSGTGPDVETKVRTAINEIFAQWPDKRTCP